MHQLNATILKEFWEAIEVLSVFEFTCSHGCYKRSVVVWILASSYFTLKAPVLKSHDGLIFNLTSVSHRPSDNCDWINEGGVVLPVKFYSGFVMSVLPRCTCLGYHQPECCLLNLPSFYGPKCGLCYAGLYCPMSIRYSTVIAIAAFYLTLWCLIRSLNRWTNLEGFLPWSLVRLAKTELRTRWVCFNNWCIYFQILVFQFLWFYLNRID